AASWSSVPFNPLLGDDDALQFVGALTDTGERRVAIEPLDIHLLRVAVGTVNAQRLGAVFQRRFRGEILGHAGLEIAALATIEGIGGIERQQSRRPRPRRHLAELELDRLMLADRLAEGPADLRILGGQSQGSLGNAGTAGGNIDATEFKPTGRLDEALSFAATDQMLLGDAIVLENQLAGIDALVAEFLQLPADAEAGLFGGNEQAHALVSGLRRRVGLDQQGHARALDAVRDPGLGAVDHVMVAVAPRRHADRLQIGAGVGL